MVWLHPAGAPERMLLRKIPAVVDVADDLRPVLMDPAMHGPAVPQISDLFVAEIAMRMPESLTARHLDQVLRAVLKTDHKVSLCVGN